MSAQKFPEKYTQYLAYTAVILLLTGFLFNRVINNVGLLLAGVHAVIYLKDSWKMIKSWPLYILLGVILFPTIHDLIFEGAGFLRAQNTLKWSLIVYPIFFAGTLRYEGFLKNISFLSIGFLSFASTYSLVGYFQNFTAVTDAYGMAKVMKVLSYSDHIRISWATVVTIILALVFVFTEKNKWIKTALWLAIIFQFVYIHILSAKTGLVSLYSTLLVLLLGVIIQKGRKWALIILPAILLFPVLAYHFIPSFYNRVEYTKHDYYHYKRNNFQFGLSDALRLYSLEGGIEMVKEAPVTGVGFARLQQKMNDWYKIHKPVITPNNYFLPSSQWLIYQAAGGITGGILILMFCLIFLVYYRKNLMFLAFYLPVVLSLCYETHLETQTGIFVFGFFLGLFMALYKEKTKSLSQNELIIP
ncbi:MAG: O-antigen ligase family protein [Saprospiraceae bacterium]|nr:O-antigen ligase family protein [Saprospiraceae bacterium]